MGRWKLDIAIKDCISVINSTTLAKLLAKLKDCINKSEIPDETELKKSA